MTEVALTMLPGRNITVENNTVLGYGNVMYDVQCSPFVSNCTGATYTFNNNLSKGYPDPGNSGKLASGFNLGTGITAGMFTATNNLWNTMNGAACPDGAISDSNPICADPLIVGESNVDALNPNLTSSSPAIGAGIHISGILTDFNGTARPNPPSVGAFEPTGAPPVQFNGNVTLSGTVRIP
jgi:hypothetical protein